MPKNFFSDLKRGFSAATHPIQEFSHTVGKIFEPAEKVLSPSTRVFSKATKDFRHSTSEVINTIKRHPLESAAVVGTAALGGAAIVMSGGAATPLVAEAEATELTALSGLSIEEAATLQPIAVSSAEVGTGAVETAPIVEDAVISDASELNPLLEDEQLVERTVSLDPIEEVSDAELQAFIDEEFGQGFLDVSSPAQVEQAIVENPSLVSRLASLGSKGIKVLGTVQAVAGIPLTISAMIDKAKIIKNEKNTAKRVKLIGELITQSNIEQAKFSGKEIELLGDLGKGVNKLGDTLEQVEEADKTIKRLINKESQIELDNNKQLKNLIKENQSETEAIKHSQVVLDNELQALEKEEEKEEDTLNMIRTNLDRPLSVEDFLKDINSFNTHKAKLDYVVENYTSFINLSQPSIDKILALLNKTETNI